MNMLNVEEMKWIEDSVEDIKKISEKINTVAPQAVSASVTPAEEEKLTSGFAKMKAFVRKAVDCCIE